jgi:hypothetical protein
MTHRQPAPDWPYPWPEFKGSKRLSGFTWGSTWNVSTGEETHYPIEPLYEDTFPDGEDAPRAESEDDPEA